MRAPAGPAALLLALLVVTSVQGLSLPSGAAERGASGAPHRLADAGAGAAAPELAATPLLSPSSRLVGGLGLSSPHDTGARADSSRGGAGGGGARPDAIATVFTDTGLAALRRTGALAAVPASVGTLTAATPADRGTAFDPERARLLATLQSIAYCADADAVLHWSCARCGAVPGFVPFLAHVDSAWDLSGYAGYLPSLDAKVRASAPAASPAQPGLALERTCCVAAAEARRPRLGTPSCSAPRPTSPCPTCSARPP
jgi:hypothetical protein